MGVVDNVDGHFIPPIRFLPPSYSSLISFLISTTLQRKPSLCILNTEKGKRKN
jgi:hypothetical protein